MTRPFTTNAVLQELVEGYRAERDQRRAELVSHCACTYCTDTLRPDRTLCGQRWEGPPPRGPRVPDNACVVCLDLSPSPCGRCGR